MSNHQRVVIYCAFQVQLLNESIWVYQQSQGGCLSQAVSGKPLNFWRSFTISLAGSKSRLCPKIENPPLFFCLGTYLTPAVSKDTKTSLAWLLLPTALLAAWHGQGDSSTRSTSSECHWAPADFVRHVLLAKSRYLAQVTMSSRWVDFKAHQVHCTALHHYMLPKSRSSYVKTHKIAGTDLRKGAHNLFHWL